MAAIAAQVPDPRPASATPGLGDSVRTLRGVGDQRAALLERLGVRTIRDLVYLTPRTYVERPPATPIGTLAPVRRATVVARVVSAAVRGWRGGRRDLVARVQDASGELDVVWFHQPYLQTKIRPGVRLALWGEVVDHRGLELRSPAFEVLAAAGRGEVEGPAGEDPEVPPAWREGRLMPVYPLTEGISQRQLRGLVEQALAVGLTQLRETLGPGLLARLRLPERVEALRLLHAPATSGDVRRGRERLVFDEFLGLLLRLGRWRHQQAARRRGRVMRAAARHRQALQSLPFALTRAQRRALAAILADMASPRVMHRLLEGDVGSGKTVVALLAAAAAADAGCQSAMLVPTEILAHQHGASAARLVPELRVGVLTGGTAAVAGERQAVVGALGRGELDLVIGTHALFAHEVRFPRLGLVIIDEQHRFGVAQRAALHAKGEDPDMLVMTATPIPRSLALTVFGDLDLTVIDERPPGRRPPRTFVAEPEHRERVLRYLDQRIAAGRQVVVIAPRIEATDASGLVTARECFAELRRHPLLRRRRLALLHGRQSLADKQSILRGLDGGQIDLLVATTVVEVGLDVPRLAAIMIEHPERFGLSQLHQLRGRVGRGAERGECILQLPPGLPDEARRRLASFARTHDGFRVAGLDLEARGVGELLGIRQHGFEAFQVADLVRDRRLLESARRTAHRLLREDPDLDRHPVLRAELAGPPPPRSGTGSCLSQAAPLAG